MISKINTISKNSYLLGRTTLIIAHRLSTIRSASRIISIADGRITECGPHDELVDKGGIYADLYRTQHGI